ncbi:hypothetical protein POM88_011129 [Heracleum sosnowskyi]|uniref:SKP1 component dimerisation domain-containing protein n=1 Tax=Heracleum sosnowskyi TaxID=360622 RepID=A0AAD8N257_9APIA|nr:hypothetical protein POM88_011129 [Heracleum sosnowskyi]
MYSQNRTALQSFDELNIDDEYVNEADLSTLFNLIQVAHQFKSKSLMDLTCQTLVNRVNNKTLAEISKEFNIDQESSQSPDEKHLKRPPRGLQDLYDDCTENWNADSILRQRGREIFIKTAIIEDLQLSPFVSNQLSFVDRREKICSDYVHELMECTDFDRLLKIINSLSILISEDQKSADLVDSETARYVLQIATFDEYEKDDIQCQAVYILSRVSIDKCYDVMTNDVIPVLVRLMSNSFYHLAIAAVIALTRLANTFPGHINVILDNGGLEAALKAAKECRHRQKIIYCLARFLAVVCRSYHLPPDKVEVAVNISEEFFQNDLICDYHKVHACHTLQYLTYGRDVEIGEQLLHKLVGIIRKFQNTEDTLIASTALGVVGNIARWGNPNMIQVLTLNCKLLLECLRDIMLWCKLKKFWKEACQIISNVAARSKTSIKDICDEVDLLVSLCSLLEKDDSDVKMEAAWAICNCIYGNRNRHILQFRQIGIMSTSSSSSASSSSSEYDEIFSLIEIFKMTYLGSNDELEVKPEDQMGFIKLCSNRGVQYVYKVDAPDMSRPSIKFGDEIDVTVNGSTCSSDYKLNMQYDLFCGAYKGRKYLGWRCDDDDDEAISVQVRLESADGCGEIVVIMGCFSMPQ